jgi:hypothetical protein
VQDTTIDVPLYPALDILATVITDPTANGKADWEANVKVALVVFPLAETTLIATGFANADPGRYGGIT